MIDIVCISVNNWESRMARKQQLMKALSRNEEIGRVLYVEPPVSYWRLWRGAPLAGEARARFRRATRADTDTLSEKLFVYTPVFLLPGSYRYFWIYALNWMLALPALRRALKEKGLNKPVLWLYHPFDIPLLTGLPHGMSVFDWAEDWEQYCVELSKPMRHKIGALQEALCASSDIVFTVSHALAARARAHNLNTFFLRDGTDMSVFSTGAPIRIPEMEAIPGPIIGYFGTLGHRFDADLVLYAAQRLTHCSFVLIGAHDASRLDIAQLRKQPNIHCMGERPYEQLGSFARYCAAFILPYRTDVTSGFPTKLFDYFAAGKPVVTTPLIELEDMREYLFTAHTPEEFVSGIIRALSCAEKEGEMLRAFASRQDWTYKAAEVMRVLSGAMR